MAVKAWSTAEVGSEPEGYEPKLELEPGWYESEPEWIGQQAPSYEPEPELIGPDSEGYEPEPVSVSLDPAWSEPEGDDPELQA